MRHNARLGVTNVFIGVTNVFILRHTMHSLSRTCSLVSQCDMHYVSHDEDKRQCVHHETHNGVTNVFIGVTNVFILRHTMHSLCVFCVMRHIMNTFVTPRRATFYVAVWDVFIVCGTHNGVTNVYIYYIVCLAHYEHIRDTKDAQRFAWPCETHYEWRHI